jgi:hypothetical protein
MIYTSTPSPTQPDFNDHGNFSVAQAEKLLNLSPREWIIYRSIKKRLLATGQNAIPISNSLWEKITGFDARNATKAIKKLLQKRIVISQRGRWKDGWISFYSINHNTHLWLGKKKVDPVVKFHGRVAHAFRTLLRCPDKYFTCAQVAEVYRQTSGTTLSARKIGYLLNKIGAETRDLPGGNRGITRRRVKRLLELKLVKDQKKSPRQTHYQSISVTSQQKGTCTINIYKLNTKERKNLIHILKGMELLDPGGYAYQATLGYLKQLKKENQRAGP